MSAHTDPNAAHRFRDLVATRLGLRFSSDRHAHLSDVMHRRARAHGFTLTDYLDGLAAGPLGAEAGALAEELTIGETYFFRHAEQLAAFSGTALTERLAARVATPSLSILCVGCSSGEEPYTLAMLTHDLNPDCAVNITAIDLNPAALRRARRGRYAAWALRETPEPMLRRWFSGAGDTHLLSQTIRSAVSFKLANVADPACPAFTDRAYDMIFCRNVIMHLTPDAQAALIARCAEALLPGGFLFLAPAESLRGRESGFALRHVNDGFFYERRDPLTLSIPVPDPVAATPNKAAAPSLRGSALPVRTPPPPPPFALADILELVRGERFAQALVAIEAMPPAMREAADLDLLRAVLLAQCSRLAAAAELCGLLLQRDTPGAGAHYVLGLCFEGTGNLPSASHHYQLASTLDPDFAMPLLRRGQLARRGGALGAARDDLRRAGRLLATEGAERLLMFGGGFTRTALVDACANELAACGDAP